MHDFAVISLSDHLTPWELIEKRLDMAAQADFVIALYNPKSRERRNHLNKAIEIILKTQSPRYTCRYCQKRLKGRADGKNCNSFGNTKTGRRYDKYYHYRQPTYIYI